MVINIYKVYYRLTCKLHNINELGMKWGDDPHLVAEFNATLAQIKKFEPIVQEFDKRAIARIANNNNN